MTRSTARPARGGFTLVEVLVALAVAGVTIAAGFGALATLQDQSARARQAATEALAGAGARALLVDWIGGARAEDPDLDVRFEGWDAAQQAIPSDELHLPTTAATPTEAPTTLVRLYLDVDPATPERGLVAEFLGRVTDLPRRMEIAPEATAIDLRYLPDVDGDAQWQTSWIGREGLPRAVELRLGSSPGAPLPPLLRLPIRVALVTVR